MGVGVLGSWPEGARVEALLGVFGRIDVEAVTNGGPTYHNGPVRAQIVLMAGVGWNL